MKYKTKIQLVADKYTGRRALLMTGNEEEGGKRITPKKDTGSWTVIETFNCDFTTEDLEEFKRK